MTHTSIASRFAFDVSRTYRNSCLNPDPFGLANKKAQPATIGIKTAKEPKPKQRKPGKPRKERTGVRGRPDSLLQKITPEQLQAALDRAPREGISNLAREYGVSRWVLERRLKRLGYKRQSRVSPEQLANAIERNSHPRLRHSTGRISVLAKEMGIPTRTLHYEFTKAGYTPPTYDPNLYAQAFDEGYSIAEVSQILDIPVNTIKKRLYAIGKKLPRRSIKQRREIRANSNFVLTKE